MSWTDREKTLATITVICATLLVVAVLTANWHISSYGTVKTFGFKIYRDQQCTLNLTSINWGSLAPGDVAAGDAYAKNTKNTALTLSMNTSNWIPASAKGYLSFSWNYTGSVILPQKVLPLRLTLKVWENVTGVDAFSFDINIYAKET